MIVLYIFLDMIINYLTSFKTMFVVLGMNRASFLEVFIYSLVIGYINSNCLFYLLFIGVIYLFYRSINVNKKYEGIKLDVLYLLSSVIYFINYGFKLKILYLYLIPFGVYLIFKHIINYLFHIIN